MTCPTYHLCSEDILEAALLLLGSSNVNFISNTPWPYVMDKEPQANRKMRHGTNCLMNCLCTDLNNSRSLLHKSSCLLFDDLCLKAGSVYWSR